MTDTCFVIMPYGEKQDIDGNTIDFESIYENLIKKACVRVDGLDVLRCDDIQLPGWIHERMIEQIFEARVAIVDTSTLNANVFYELGVRHALRPSVTILVHRKGTSWPFNIAGLSSIEYGETDAELRDARKRIRNHIENAIVESNNIDSLVHLAIPDLNILQGDKPDPKRITQYGVDTVHLSNQPTKKIGFVTGDYEAIKIADIWVTSENTDMQMDSYYGKSTSASVRFLGARKHQLSGRVVEDTIADELAALMGEEKSVEPGTVVVTGSGELRSNNVKWIFHTASVAGQPREGYKPIDRIDRCIRNVLEKADSVAIKSTAPLSILLPIFGTGPAGGDLETHLFDFVATTVDYFERNPESMVEAAYFYVWTDIDLSICRRIALEFDGLDSRFTSNGVTLS